MNETHPRNLMMSLSFSSLFPVTETKIKKNDAREEKNTDLGNQKEQQKGWRQKKEVKERIDDSSSLEEEDPFLSFCVEE